MRGVPSRADAQSAGSRRSCGTAAAYDHAVHGLYAAPGAYARRCLETLDAALQRTAMYESWRALDPGEDTDLDDRFAALPVLTKADIRAHFPKGIVPRGLDLDEALARGEVGFVRTSGTADEALTNIWNQQWWDASERASWKLNSTAARAATGSHREAILASSLSVGPRSEGPAIARGLRTLGRFLFLNEYGTPAEWPGGHERRMLEELADFKPTVLEANPSLLARLSRFASRAGVEVFQPELITLTYEFPSAIHLRAIRGVFGSPIASSYGSTEAGYVFMECENGFLHQNADFCRVDLLPLGRQASREKRRESLGDEPLGRRPRIHARAAPRAASDAPQPSLALGRREAVVSPGQLGRIVVTTFGNPWFPLLRFEIGDVGRLSDAPCPCGRGFGLTLSAVEGRLGSVCLASDGRHITHLELDRAIAEVGGIEGYRLDQDEPGSARLQIVTDDGRGVAAAHEAKEALHGLFGAGAMIDVRDVPSLLPEKSGKFLLAKRWCSLEAGPHESAQGAARVR